MSPPRIDQINVVVEDVDATATFLVGLGVDLDSNGFAQHWVASLHRSAVSWPTCEKTRGPK